MKKIYSILCLAVFALFVSCDKPSEEVQGGVGTCVPVLDLDEFVFLCWYEIIDIGADVLLDEFQDPKMEWRLQKLKEAGFNTYFDYRLDSYAEAEALLSTGDKVGINIVVECPELHDEATTEQVVQAMSAHESLFGYNVWGEPDVAEFPGVIRRIREIYKYDKKHLCYVNLYPNYGLDEWTEDNYLTTVRQYLKTIPASFLSFDYYPVIIKEGQRIIRDAWYHNLEDIRTAAEEADVPIWAFAMSKALGSNPKPTLADLRLQQFSNLVYGAVAFQYFTARGLVWDDYVTDVYYYVKQVNQELKQMEGIFLGADIKDVWHVGKSIPRGTKELKKCPSGISGIDVGDGNAVISHFVNNGRQYVALVNSSCTEELSFSITFTAEASHVAKDGAETPVSPDYVVDPGDIKIFTWR